MDSISDAETQPYRSCLTSLHNCISQFPVTSFFIYVCMCSTREAGPVWDIQRYYSQTVCILHTDSPSSFRWLFPGLHSFLTFIPYISILLNTWGGLKNFPVFPLCEALSSLIFCLQTLAALIFLHSTFSIFGVCCGSTCVPSLMWLEYVPQSLCVRSLISNVTILRVGTFKGWLGHEDDY